MLLTAMMAQWLAPWPQFLDGSPEARVLGYLMTLKSRLTVCLICPFSGPEMCPGRPHLSANHS